MKLLLHNMLSSQFLKNVKEGYPLILRATNVKRLDFTFVPETHRPFVTKMMPRINYPVLLKAAESIGIQTGLPPEPVENWETNDEFVQKIAELIMSVEVVDGELECPETGRRFIIREGIPNMLVQEEEDSS